RRVPAREVAKHAVVFSPAGAGDETSPDGPQGVEREARRNGAFVQDVAPGQHLALDACLPEPPGGAVAVGDVEHVVRKGRWRVRAEQNVCGGTAIPVSALTRSRPMSIFSGFETAARSLDPCNKPRGNLALSALVG